MAADIKNVNSAIVSTEQIIRRAVQVIGAKWRLTIIYLLRDKPLRYGEIKRLIPEISEKVLAHELKQLVELGMVTRTSYGEVPPRVEYLLNEKGSKVLPVIDLLSKIGDRFL